MCPTFTVDCQEEAADCRSIPLKCTAEKETRKHTGTIEQTSWNLHYEWREEEEEEKKEVDKRRERVLHDIHRSHTAGRTGGMHMCAIVCMHTQHKSD